MLSVLRSIGALLVAPFRALAFIRAAASFGWDCELFDPWELPDDDDLLDDAVPITRC
ncbi:hypothetical protein I5G81_gp89 [Mycobacterium phage Shandong1]|uniref:Uncharacterized protein n=1 Tax=Mycobacterium phage Shandong1 TaxID=1983447 RepID=A0A1X9SHI4_9CAUD|nr:hypothetical protein I5G81_gp89 [Mycobacterium phage Shandong1]ARQ95528.1 hypothetical protein [Mycobacterium phage Shandong1]